MNLWAFPLSITDREGEGLDDISDRLLCNISISYSTKVQIQG